MSGIFSCERRYQLERRVYNPTWNEVLQKLFPQYNSTKVTCSVQLEHKTYIMSGHLLQWKTAHLHTSRWPVWCNCGLYRWCYLVWFSVLGFKTRPCPFFNMRETMLFLQDHALSSIWDNALSSIRGHAVSSIRAHALSSMIVQITKRNPVLSLSLVSVEYFYGGKKFLQTFSHGKTKAEMKTRKN